MKYAIFVLSLLVSFGVSADPQVRLSNQDSARQAHVPFDVDLDNETFISASGVNMALPIENGVRSVGVVVDVDMICDTLPEPLAALGIGEEVVINSTMVDIQPANPLNGNSCLAQDVNTIGSYHSYWEGKHIRIESPFEQSHGLCRFRVSMKCASEDFLSLE